MQDGPKHEKYCVFKDFTKNCSDFTPDKHRWWESKDAESYRNARATLFLESLASCTAITYVNDKLIGDPLDVKMFEATGWVLEEPHNKTLDAKVNTDD